MTQIIKKRFLAVLVGVLVLMWLALVVIGHHDDVGAESVSSFDINRFIPVTKMDLDVPESGKYIANTDQNLINAFKILGYDTSNMDATIRFFQTSKKLNVDGKAGAKTIPKINEELTNSFKSNDIYQDGNNQYYKKDGNDYYTYQQKFKINYKYTNQARNTINPNAEYIPISQKDLPNGIIPTPPQGVKLTYFKNLEESGEEGKGATALGFGTDNKWYYYDNAKQKWTPYEYQTSFSVTDNYILFITKTQGSNPTTVPPDTPTDNNPFVFYELSIPNDRDFDRDGKLTVEDLMKYYADIGIGNTESRENIAKDDGINYATLEKIYNSLENKKLGIDSSLIITLQKFPSESSSSESPISDRDSEAYNNAKKNTDEYNLILKNINEQNEDLNRLTSEKEETNKQLTDYGNELKLVNEKLDRVKILETKQRRNTLTDEEHSELLILNIEQQEETFSIQKDRLNKDIAEKRNKLDTLNQELINLNIGITDSKADANKKNLPTLHTLYYQVENGEILSYQFAEDEDYVYIYDDNTKEYSVFEFDKLPEEIKSMFNYEPAFDSLDLRFKLQDLILQNIDIKQQVALQKMLTNRRQWAQQISEILYPGPGAMAIQKGFEKIIGEDITNKVTEVADELKIGKIAKWSQDPYYIEYGICDAFMDEPQNLRVPPTRAESRAGNYQGKWITPLGKRVEYKLGGELYKGRCPYNNNAPKWQPGVSNGKPVVLGYLYKMQFVLTHPYSKEAVDKFSSDERKNRGLDEDGSLRFRIKRIIEPCNSIGIKEDMFYGKWITLKPDNNGQFKTSISFFEQAFIKEVCIEFENYKPGNFGYCKDRECCTDVVAEETDPPSDFSLFPEGTNSAGTTEVNGEISHFNGKLDAKGTDGGKCLPGERGITAMGC